VFIEWRTAPPCENSEQYADHSRGGNEDLRHCLRQQRRDNVMYVAHHLASYVQSMKSCGGLCCLKV
jgi:hypothetical protein